ncbi:MAG TPA: hypothetical protein VEE84_03860 [Burkholderiaceae bacterium]|nr:hypothetical protein [Burkholderiaceae bacterium]
MLRVFSTLLLALLVVGAQQGALLHEISHGIGHHPAKVSTRGGNAVAPAKPPASHPAGGESNSYCDKCFQFSHVNGADFASAPAPAPIVAQAEVALGTQAADLPSDVPQRRSRGPPIIL